MADEKQDDKKRKILSEKEALEEADKMFLSAWALAKTRCTGKEISSDQAFSLALVFTLSSAILILASAASLDAKTDG